MKRVDVIIDQKSEYTDTAYTYLAPDDIAVGDRVVVPFARQKKGREGYVIAVDVETSLPDSKLREVASVDRDRSLTAEMIETALWIRRRYGVKYIDAIKMFTVPGKKYEPKEIPESVTEEAPELTEEQRAAVREILASIHREDAHEVLLLQGVTNSGKTEVYMQAAAEALRMGKSVILLVPEIALSAQTEKRLRRRFGDRLVATLHSKQRTTEKLSEWKRIRSGEARIVIGPRTSVFAPVQDLGLIILDEEHETTYKSDFNPKYETIDIAYCRAQAHKCPIVLGSATPSVVSYYRSETGIYRRLEMKERIGISKMPQFEIVDMKDELRAGNTGLISRRLLEETEYTLERGEQVIYFLNRRGYSTQIRCLQCGSRMLCPDCEIPLVYHKKENAAICHYCGRKFPVMRRCPECGSEKIALLGTGTERIEDRIKELLPGYEIERFDLDTAVSKRAIEAMLGRFRKGKTQLLVGTQILAKGLDFKNVGLVGILSADTMLNLPDYRAAERTYQLITQVAGRAGRGQGESRVLLQTMEPENEVIQAAAQGDYQGFYFQELEHRRIMKYPPYTDIIEVFFVDKKDKKPSEPSKTMAYAEDFRNRLLTMQGAPKDAVLLPPQEDSRRGGAERNRVSFLIKAPKGTRSGYMKAYMDYREHLIKCNASCHIEIDVNPY